MSIEAMAWAWRLAEEGELSSGQAFVLVCLGNHGSTEEEEDWTCFPSVETLMRRCRLSRSAVERHLKWLESEGMITRARVRLRGGRLGPYRYVLHREPGVREALKRQRSQGVGGLGEMPSPCGDLQHGGRGSPCGDLSGAMRQFDGPPCGDLPHVYNRQDNPQDNPQDASAREPLADGSFETVFAAWGRVIPDGAARGPDRAAWRVALVAIEPDVLAAAALRYLDKSPAVKRGRGRSLARWLADQCWEPWLEGGAETVAMAAPAWTGPAEIRAMAVARRGEGWAASWIDPCGWRDDGAVLVARTRMAAETLERERRSSLFEGLVSRVEFYKGEA